MKNEIASRMKNLAIEVIQFVEGLPRTQTAGILGKQVVRSATGIGANYRAACRARSRADFVAKVAIAEEESDETQYWLELLHESGLIGDDKFERLHDDRPAHGNSRRLREDSKTTSETIEHISPHSPIPNRQCFAPIV